jgi:hypothetical protein
MAAQAVAPATLELSCLSSDLLSKVTHFLDTEELCAFDTAILNRQLRAKYLVGVSNDAFLFRGEDIDGAERQQIYARWLLLHRVFLKVIKLNSSTNATTLEFYDVINRNSAGLEELFLDGKVDFPKDLAVRNAKTLHSLMLTGQGKHGSWQEVGGNWQLRGLLKRIREWAEAGGVLKELHLRDCEFGDETVDVGSCDSLTYLCIENCRSNQYTAPGISQGCTRLVWDIVSKCTNLKTVHFESNVQRRIDFSDKDLSVLARFCPNLDYLFIDTPGSDSPTDKAIVCLATKCTKLTQLCLYTKTALTDETILAVAANLVSLKVLGLANLQMQNPLTLRCLAHCCPQLSMLNLHKGNVSEAELLYLVKHAKNLQKLGLERWGHLSFRDGVTTEHTLQEYDEQELSLVGAEEPARLLSSRLEWLGRMAVHTQLQPGEMDTLEKLKAASSHPRFKVNLLEALLYYADEDEGGDEDDDGDWEDNELLWADEDD